MTDTSTLIEFIDGALDKVNGVEINPSNYTHDDACNLNNGYVQLFGALEEVKKMLQPREIPVSGDEIERVARAIHDTCANFDPPKGKTPAYNLNRNKDGWRAMSKAAIAAMRPTERESGNGWQPIESAPRNGDEILAYWSSGKTYGIICWEVGKWFDETGPVSAPTHWRHLDEPKINQI